MAIALIIFHHAKNGFTLGFIGFTLGFIYRAYHKGRAEIKF